MLSRNEVRTIPADDASMADPVTEVTDTESLRRRVALRGGALGIDIAAVMTSSAATGALGFVFWTVAARGYDIAEVGRASAIISSATLIAILANFSLGSLYERFLPVAGRRTRGLINTGFAFIVLTALLFGVAFMLLGPREQLFRGWLETALFPVFVAVLALFAIQDQILVGLGRARAIATKNITQSTAKLVAVAALIPLATGSAIVWAWVLPAAVIAGWIALRTIRPASRQQNTDPDLPPTREVFGFFASSYAINAVGVIVPLLVPLIIVAKLGTEMNAYFSVCWLVINTVGVLIGATAAPFVATASTPGADLWSSTVRFAVMCGGAAITGCLALLVCAPVILGILGPEYAAHGTDLIRIMALTLPSLALLSIYTALARLRRRLKLAVAVQILLGVLVVTGVSITTPRWGIDAVGYTYLAAELCCTLIIIGPAVVLIRRARATRADAPAHVTTATELTPVRRPVATTASETDPDIDAQSVSQRFTDVVAEHGERIALQTAHGTTSYRELAATAHHWARFLAGQGEPGSTVALLAGTNPGSVAAVLGSFAAGRTLVPLDPALPTARITEILAILDTAHRAAQALITDAANRSQAEGLPTECPTWPAEHPPTAPEVSDRTEPAAPQLHPQSVTSIQFTSGSTGKPKAVLHTHGSWLCDALLLRNRFGMTAGTRVAVCMPISFAAGLNVLMASLMSGAQVLVVDPREEAIETVLGRLTEASVIACTPSFLQALVDAARGRTLPQVNRIVTTGEPISGRLMRQAQTLVPNAALSNWAGSSETLAIAHYDVNAGDPVPDGVIPAGIPAPHKKIDIDADGRVTVTSRYLPLGYLDPDQSAAHFRDNPDGSRTFLTGDRGRWDDDGNLLLLGRIDAAVKIRGYLVEPAEIEAALLDHPGIREAVVTVTTSDGVPALSAYVVPVTDARTPSMAELRAELQRRLPLWMIPAHFVTLTDLPRNERGKLDRRALPEPVRGRIEAPVNERESELAALWAEVLCLDAVGRTENFYGLGGDSLTVQHLLALLRSRHEISLASSDLASAPTVADLATLITTRRDPTTRPDRRTLAPTTVALRASSIDTPTTLFCFAGAGASALTFMPLADRLGPQVAVYAFQPHGLENRGLPDWTVAAAARRHLVDLVRLQPQGPVTLIGHSLGSFIALEVAHRLRAMGRTVNLVVMLDPFLPPRAMTAARQLLPSATLTLDAPPVSRRELWRRRLWLPLAGIAPLRTETQGQALEEVGVRVGLLHRPRPYSGRALVVLSHLNRDDPRLWPFVVTGPLDIERVDCDHDSVVREPHIGRVVEMITAAIGHRATPPSGEMAPITP